MSQTLESPAADATVGAPTRPRWITWWRVAACVLVVSWGLLVGLVAFTGEQDANRHDFLSDRMSGEVYGVHVYGRLPARGAVEVHWRTSPVSAYRATIDVERLRELHGGIDRRDGHSSDVSIMDRHVVGGGYALIGMLSLLMGTLALLVTSPWLRRGTPFGWFWPMFMLAPVGPLLYLLLGGPLARTTPPAPDRGWRLTGGWSFLLCLLVVSWIRGG